MAAANDLLCALPNIRDGTLAILRGRIGQAWPPQPASLSALSHRRSAAPHRQWKGEMHACGTPGEGQCFIGWKR